MKKYEGIKSIEGYWDDECFPAVKGKHVDVNDCVIFTSDESPAEIFREVNAVLKHNKIKLQFTWITFDEENDPASEGHTFWLRKG